MPIVCCRKPQLCWWVRFDFPGRRSKHCPTDHATASPGNFMAAASKHCQGHSGNAQSALTECQKQGTSRATGIAGLLAKQSLRGSYLDGRSSGLRGVALEFASHPAPFSRSSHAARGDQTVVLWEGRRREKLINKATRAAAPCGQTSWTAIAEPNNRIPVACSRRRICDFSICCVEFRAGFGATFRTCS